MPSAVLRVPWPVHIASRVSPWTLLYLISACSGDMGRATWNLIIRALQLQGHVTRNSMQQWALGSCVFGTPCIITLSDFKYIYKLFISWKFVKFNDEKAVNNSNFPSITQKSCFVVNFRKLMVLSHQYHVLTQLTGYFYTFQSGYLSHYDHPKMKYRGTSFIIIWLFNIVYI